MKQTDAAYRLPLPADFEELKKIFSAYGFRDKMGHPLLMCSDFEQLISEFCDLKTKQNTNS